MREVLAVRQCAGCRLTVSQEQPAVSIYGAPYMLTSAYPPVRYTLDGLRLTPDQVEAVLVRDGTWRGWPSLSRGDRYYPFARPDGVPEVEINGLELTEAEARAILVGGLDPVTVLCGDAPNGIVLVFNMDGGADR